MPLNSQLGVKDEGTYGTAVVVDRFFEFDSEAITPDRRKIESPALRADGRVRRKDRVVPYLVGAGGPITLPVMTKGFGWWLKHLCGAVTTSGPGAQSEYTHTGTFATLKGDSFTAQVNKRDEISEADRAITVEGGKVAKWSLECSVEGILTLNVETLYEDLATSTALASASYPTSADLLTWVRGDININSSQVPMESFKVEVDNGLDDARLKQKVTTRREEPIEKQLRQITFEAVCDFDALTEYERSIAETIAGATIDIDATWEGPSVIGGAVYPHLKVEIDEGYFDTVEVAVSDEAPLKQTIKGVGLYDGSAEPFSVEYVTADTSP